MKYSIEYSFGRYKLRLNFWLLIVFLLVQTLLNELGFWQLNRAKEKQIRIQQLEKGIEYSLNSLQALTPEHLSQFQSVELTTELIVRKSFFLDNKVRNGQPGYQVLHLVRDLSSEKNLLVNRGWVFTGETRNKLPGIELPGREWNVSGRLYPVIESAITTDDAEIENLSQSYRLPVLDGQIIKQLEKIFDLEIEPYFIRLNADSEAALDTNWVWTNMSPQKHLAYAIQWFGLALAFLIVSLVASIKKGE